MPAKAGMKTITLTIALVVSTIFAFAQNNPSTQAASAKSVSLRYIEQVLNKKKLSLVDSLFSTDYVLHETNGTTSFPAKNKTLTPYLTYLFKAFPDLHYTVDYIISEGAKVAAYCTVTGTHKGEFYGAEPTGKKIRYAEMVTYRIENGKIAEAWSVADVYGLRQQLLTK